MSDAEVRTEGRMVKAVDSLVGIVDDDESVRESISSLLRSAGYRTAVFESAEALLRSGRFRDSVCLVVDIRMPGLSGLELQIRLQNMNCLTPVIFVTAHSTDEARRKALKQGAIAFFGKPFSDDALLQAVGSTRGSAKN